MATLLLSAAGASIGGSIGGSFLGLASGVVGRAVGATIGATIDQRLTGLGSEPVEAGRVERFKVMGASEGVPLPRVFGRMRVAGQVIWASRFLERVSRSRVGGKGGGARSQEVRKFSYSVSLAIALCEGEVMRIGRVWADGQPLDMSGVTWRLHVGSDDQLADPLIAAIEGAEAAPTYRGTAYLVLDNLELAPFGNRVPQFNVEVFRRADTTGLDMPTPPSLSVRGVALVPGTGEYALATTPVYFNHGRGRTVVANVHNDRGQPDLLVSLEHLKAELPNAKAVSLVVSWFGDDLRCDRCTLQPSVEQAEHDGKQQPWNVCGVARSAARVVSRSEDRPVFGGTPSDASVVQAIQHLRESGQSVMFYPFILMDILPSNVLRDPWTGAGRQPAVPWRGRITLPDAPGRPGSIDKTPAAAIAVAAFFGAAEPEDFSISNGRIEYSGPQEWSYRRFILHYAKLCAFAGGVDSFCIGSEMRSLSQIRDGIDGYPAVRELCRLAADVRRMLGTDPKIGYAADWSEYFGHQPNDGSGDVLFHLDPLWAHPDIDFVGIDNYMPLSDWRDGLTHADADVGSIYDANYLRTNVAGGEGFDWYYDSLEGRQSQTRLPITDGSYGEHWIFRYKDIKNWWSRSHHDRIGGIRKEFTTAWGPRSKPVWFTEIGCPAIDKGTNQPNVFLDPKSSESFTPYFSSGGRDDFIQKSYLRAIFEYWNDDLNNPMSESYQGRMVDMSNAYVWAWDARPWPDFPRRLETWIDGANYSRGHWVNARLASPSVRETVGELCATGGLSDIDTDRLYGCLAGYLIQNVETARKSLQALMTAFGFDGICVENRIEFIGRGATVSAAFDAMDFAMINGEPLADFTRDSGAEVPESVSIDYFCADSDYELRSTARASSSTSQPGAFQSSIPIALFDVEANAIAERWLYEMAASRTTARFRLPLSDLEMTVGDVITIRSSFREDSFRIDKIEDIGTRTITAVRIEAAAYQSPGFAERQVAYLAVAAATPVYSIFLDLPLLTGEESPHAPYIAVGKSPWAGSVAVYSAANDFGYKLNREIHRPATFGRTLEPLNFSRPDCWSRSTLRVKLDSGELQSSALSDVLNGSNTAVIRFGGVGEWEVVQFANAKLIGASEFELTNLLRGQVGTGWLIPSVLPDGAEFVLIDDSVVQLGLAASLRDIDWNYRVGPSALPYDDTSFTHHIVRSSCAGLRPYAPAHLKVTENDAGDLYVSWKTCGFEYLDGELDFEENESIRGLNFNIKLSFDSIVFLDKIVNGRSFFNIDNNILSDTSEIILHVEVSQVTAAFGSGPSSIVVHTPKFHA